MSVDTKSDKRQVALYIRVSTGTQAEDGVSLDAQEKSLRAWAKHEFPSSPIRVFREAGASAYSGKRRPEYELLVEAVRRGEIAVIAAAKPDRLNRTVSEGAKLRKLCSDVGTRIYTQSAGWVETSAFGDFNMNMLDAVGQLESGIKSERVKDANAYLREEGLFVGKPPWGYRRDGRMIVPSADAHLIRRAFELFAEGHTKSEVMRWLNDQPREERLDPLRRDNIDRILRNPVYAGFVVTDTKSAAPQRLPGKHSPLVPPELFEEVERLLITRKGHGYHGDRLLPFAGLTRCGSCHAPLRHAYAPGDGGGYHYVGCSAYCGLKAWGAPNFELAVVLHLAALGAWIDTALADGSWRTLRKGADGSQLASELDAARAERDRLVKFARSGALSDAEASRELKESRSRLLALEEAFTAASASEDEAAAELRAYRELIPQDFQAWWLSTPSAERERILPQIVNRVWLHKHGIGFMPTRCFPRPLLFAVEYERQQNMEADPTVALGFKGIREAHDSEVANVLRSAASARRFTKTLSARIVERKIDPSIIGAAVRLGGDQPLPGVPQEVTR